MKHAVVLAVVATTFFLSTTSAHAKDSGGPYKSLEVKHFTISDGVEFPSDKINPQNYMNIFYDELRTQLEKRKIADQVLTDGANVPGADAANSLIVEGKVTEFKQAGHTMAHPGVIALQISLYHRQDHSLVTTITPQIKMLPAVYRNDTTLAKVTGIWAASEIKNALK